MRDTEVRNKFAELPIHDLRDIQLASGRAAVSDVARKYWIEVHEFALGVLQDERRSHRSVELAEFVRIVTESLYQLRGEARPNYYTYTDVAILDWFLDRERPTYDDVRERSVIGILYLLEDLSRFEADSITGLEKRSQQSFSTEIATRRIGLIKNVVTQWEKASGTMTTKSLEQLRGLRMAKTVPDYVDDPERKTALVHFSAFPQSERHDEVLFLRTIHMSEFAFSGIRVSVEEAIEKMKVEDFGGAALALQQATSFASILHLIFKVLNTMPPEHFAEFRDATGDASAVQSRNYQLMDTFCCGYNEQKTSTFESIDHLRPMRLHGDPRFISLRDIIGRCVKDPRAADVIAVARELDAVLLRWRGLHLAFAKSYLPPETVGTGGTSGASYLQRFLQRTIFSDTKFEPKSLGAQFPGFAEILEDLRYEPAPAIAPPHADG